MNDTAVAVNDNLESAKRDQILNGARRCFLAQGFDGASMNDIVKAAGVSKGTVYAYCSSSTLGLRGKSATCANATTLKLAKAQATNTPRLINCSHTLKLRQQADLTKTWLTVGFD